MKKIFLLSTFFLAATSLFAQAVQGKSYKIQFNQHKGDAVSHVSTVEEEAYLNGYLNNRTQFINRTSTTVKDILDKFLTVTKNGAVTPSSDAMLLPPYDLS